MISLIRPYLPLLVKFGRDYSKLEGLTFDGWDVDKRILAELERAGLGRDRAREVKAALSGRGAGEAPRGDAARVLRQGRRRGCWRASRAAATGCPQQAARFYRFINGTADVFATDEAERVTARRDPERRPRADGASPPRDAAEPYFRRRFRKDETGEVRVYLFGGDDQVDGDGRPPWRRAACA